MYKGVFGSEYTRTYPHASLSHSRFCRPSASTPVNQNTQMKTSVASAIAVAITCRSVRAFMGHSSVTFRSSLRPTSQHSFCPSSSTSTVGGPSTRRPRTGEPRGTDRRAAGLRGRNAAGRLNMFDATDLFQLQQWAGDISATEVEDVSSFTDCCVLLLSHLPPLTYSSNYN